MPLFVAAPGPSRMNTTPSTLLERLRQPDPHDAWERFVRLYTPLLFSWARGIGLQESDAADLVQDVFTALLQKLPEFTYDRHRSFRAWLRTVTVNKWRETQRRAAATLVTGVENLAELAGAAPEDAFWETEYRNHLVGHALELMRADFEPTTWKACWEFVVSGRPAAAVAAELGTTVDVVYNAKSRVLRRLRQELDGLMD
jgi:RNA polymerase sigma-70 factor (ECF subfamily)